MDHENKHMKTGMIMVIKPTNTMQTSQTQVFKVDKNISLKFDPTTFIDPKFSYPTDAITRDFWQNRKISSRQINLA
jgi:hypothetical protein